MQESFSNIFVKLNSLHSVNTKCCIICVCHYTYHDLEQCFCAYGITTNKGKRARERERARERACARERERAGEREREQEHECERGRVEGEAVRGKNGQIDGEEISVSGPPILEGQPIFPH